ncbi:hypothetical protein QSH18_13290 [Xanthomonas sp. NCPPB 2654]|uniref:hypothetical protein n=1 Tax=unclassified Xanthomonas TaxID=2643310 RepID=UPI0021E0A150|nr:MULTISPECIES: hypothetical protein [unclassified Xanthomonas]MDL5366575.1 hypothetical protein [Xanthomonas sp. NCPPB 2654]UYC21286.1 hypothetical protein NUG20_02980 [Xanthomonas sp. CFBP 8443]
MSIKDELSARLEDIHAHGYPFPVVRAVLRAHELPTAQGWETQIEKIKDLKHEELIYAQALLKRLHLSLALYSEKAFQLFKISAGAASTLGDILTNYKPTNAFAARFPYDLSETELRAATRTINVSASLNEEDIDEFDEDGEARFFDSTTFSSRAIPTVALSGKRYKTLRAEYDINDLKSVPSALQDYDQIVAIRRIAFQFNHVVAVHETSGRYFVELRLDCSSSWLAGELEKHFLFVKGWTNQLFKSKTGTESLLKGAVNLFPSIAALYNEPEGRVRQAGSSSPSASVRDEKMRRSSLDLRQDPFHKHGVQATGKFNGHNLLKTWDSTVYETTPNLVLPGTLSIASSTEPYLAHGEIHGAACQSDYLLVLEHLIATL